MLLDPQGVKANQMQMNKKRYIKEMRRLVEVSDVLIEVLDSRDPQNCRSLEVESQIAA